MKRAAMVEDDEQNIQVGEPEYSRTDLTSVLAGDAAQDVSISRERMNVRERSPHTEVPAGDDRNCRGRAREGWHRAAFIEGDVV
jgi:hypothetical protein